uniref:uncharacterized protein LOC123994828 isoform X4 n=1 Tax=Oncorhynchus gorbuscha TaxID=8017 RepID=UPI001EAF08F1|nr:uncharacterized protein LOC123994828 isoform X4 [Oncorhynchus gorbuscha]
MLNTEALDSHSLNLRSEETDTRCNGDINDSGSHNNTEDMSVLYSSVLHLAMLLSLHSGLQNLSTLPNPTAVTLHKGNSVTIHCTHNLPNDIEIFTVTIKGTEVLCFSQFNRQECLVSKTCKESIQIKWNNETREIFFSLMNLQINDSGLYSCEVKRAAPPPAQVFSKNITICVTGPSQAGLYLCWVNHSSLSHPITVNHTVMSNDVQVRWPFIVVSIGAVLILVVLIIMIIKCTHFKRVKHLFLLGTSQEPVHTDSSVTENIIYSTLGDHHPITLSTAVPT